MGRTLDLIVEGTKQVFSGAPRAPKVTGGGAAPRYPSANIGQGVASLSTTNPRWGGAYTLDQGLSSGYEVMEIVRSVVDTLADHASSVPWRVSKFMGDGSSGSAAQAKAWYEWELKTCPPGERAALTREWKMVNGIGSEKKIFQLEPQPRHDLEKLLEQPNEFMDRKLVMSLLVMHLMLAGNSLLVKVRSPIDPSKVFEIFPLIPVGVTPVKDEDNVLTGYSQRTAGSNQELTWDFREVLHMMLPSPGNAYWGTPLLQSAMRSVQTSNEATDWNKVTFQNRGRPDIGISVQKRLGMDQLEEIRAILRSQFIGKDNARTPFIMGDDAKFQTLSMTAAELDYIESLGISARWICVNFRVDPRIVGLSDGLADADVHRMHWSTRIVPLLDTFQGLFSKKLAPEFEDDLLPWYDTSGVYAFADDVHRRIQSQKILSTQGWPNDILNRRFNLGLPEGIEGMDRAMWPASAISNEEILLRTEKLKLEVEKLQDSIDNPQPAPGTPDPGTGPKPPENDPANPDQPNPDQPGPDAPNDPSQPSLPNQSERRWYEMECELWMREWDIDFEQIPPIKTDNWYVYNLDESNTNWMRAKIQDGSTIKHDLNSGTLKAYFYHGEKNDLDMLRNMGATPEVNGHRS